MVFGTASGFSSSLDVSALDGANGFQINGAAVDDKSGISVAGAGDVNDDGFADLIVGAYLADPNGTDSGASYVVFGTASGFSSSLDVSALDGANGFQINGAAVDDRSGISVAGAGDVNDDGFADLIVGAYLADPNGTNSGASYVVFGTASGFSSSLDLSALDGANGFQIDGAAAGDKSGISVAGAGDVNGDGFADLIVGADGADPNGTYSGASYVVFGTASGFSSSLDVSALDGANGFRIDGAAAGDKSGRSVAGAGDVNSDGFADLIVGAFGADPNGTNSGASYVIYGSRPLTDVLRQGTDLANRINGGFGDDTVQGFSGRDTLIGWEGDDLIDGGSGKDRIDGGSGYDNINGGSGNDTILASAGHDTLRGGSGTDLLNIGAHFKTAAVVDLAAGTADFGGASRALLSDIENVTGTRAGDTIAGDGAANRLAGGGGKDVLDGANGNDRLNGGKGNDHLNGGRGNDVVNGGTGNDRLHGNGGADTLFGGGGNDTLAGGQGRDILHGGAGADHFVFRALRDSAPGSQRDHITDFSKVADLIDVSGMDAKAGVGGNQAFHFITGAFTGTKGELHAVNAGANSIVAGDVDGDGKAEFSILVENVNNLHAADFLL